MEGEESQPAGSSTKELTVLRPLTSLFPLTAPNPTDPGRVK